MSLKGKKSKQYTTVNYRDLNKKGTWKESLKADVVVDYRVHEFIQNAGFDNAKEEVFIKTNEKLIFPAKTVLPSLLWKYTGKKNPVIVSYDKSKGVWVAKFKKG